MCVVALVRFADVLFDGNRIEPHQATGQRRTFEQGPAAGCGIRAVGHRLIERSADSVTKKTVKSRAGADEISHRELQRKLVWAKTSSRNPHFLRLFIRVGLVELVLPWGVVRGPNSNLDLSIFPFRLLKRINYRHFWDVVDGAGARK